MVDGGFPSFPATKPAFLCQTKIDRGQIGPTDRAPPTPQEPRPPDGRGPSETPARANPAQGLASMGSCQFQFNVDAGLSARIWLATLNCFSSARPRSRVRT